ncbi:MAG: VWA domain-containing protein, partial [Pseudomonadales bacterium]
MIKKLVPVALLGMTAAAVFYLPHGFSSTPQPVTNQPIPITDPVIASVTQDAKRIEVVFALDTTGSMSGLIQAAKDKIWSIANTMASAQPAPEIAIGLVAYRDRGDAYVTKVFDLTTDLDSIYAQLIDFKAGGGGDGPESVNKALDDALHTISWSQDREVYQTVFLVGDAPAHMDYANERQFPEL